MGFTKLFQEIVTSSIWQAPYHVRIVWTSFLAIAGADGIACVSPGSVARLANITEEEAADALVWLTSTDKDSRSPEWDGRRIERVSGGYLILNHSRYRNIRTEAQKAAYMREYMREYRKKKGAESCKANSKTSRRGSLTQKTNQESWRDERKIESASALAMLSTVDFPDPIKAALLQFGKVRAEQSHKGASWRETKRFSTEQARSLCDQTRAQVSAGKPQDWIVEKILGAASGGYQKINFASFYR